MLFVASNLREFARTRAKGYKKLILDEGVDSGKTVDYKFADDGIHIVLAEEQEDMNSADTEYTFIIDKFGVYGNISSDIEVLLCDEVMMVTLKSGAIVINLNGNFMLVTRNVPDGSLPAINPEKMYWVDTKGIRDNTAFWLHDLTPMADDFIVNLTCKYQGGADRKGVQTNGVSLKPAPEDERFYDVSNGAVDVFLQNLVLQRQREEARSFMKKVTDKPVHSDDDFIYDASAYEDDDLDDEEDDDWM